MLSVQSVQLAYALNRMPRFLNTWTGEFEWHPDPNKVTYAILSHVWREPEKGGEQSYNDVRRIQKEVEEDCRVRSALLAASDGNEFENTPNLTSWAPFASVELEHSRSAEDGTIFAHRGLSRKIKHFCRVARDAGFWLAWNDACCIDKSSSAELFEAINSMFEWYRLSDMCYVYLADVSDGDAPQHDYSKLRESTWHGRGWTLQELIAPEQIVFLTQTWNFLGTKMSLAKTLESITGVDFDILVGRTTLDSVSVARRMSWAAKRYTTRVEDRAYSLLGIFGLHMSPIYGEGKNAFIRLQEEIIRTIPDQSIFAWGAKCALRVSYQGRWLAEGGWYRDEDDHCLLKSSPTSFSHCSSIEPIASSSLAKTLRLQESQIPPVHCILTPEGVSMRLVCLPLSGVPEIRNAFQGPQSARDTCTECRELGELDTLALLQCQERRETGTTLLLGLPLRRNGREGARGNRRAIRIGIHIHDDSYSWSYHTVRLEIKELMKLLEHVRPTVEDVTLLQHYSGPSVPKSLQRSGAWPRFPRGCSFFSYLKQTVFEMSPHSTDALRTLGIDPSPLQVTHLEQEIILETTLALHRRSLAGPTDVIALRLSLTNCSYHVVEANFSVKRVGVVGSGSGQSSIGAAAGASHHAVVNTPHISGVFLDLDHRNDSRTVIPFGVWDMDRRTIFHIEYTVQSEEMWGSWARVLRIALQHTFASLHDEDDLPRSNLWVSIDLSEEFSYESSTESGLDSPSSDQTGTDVCESDSETSNEHENVSPSCESTSLPVSADREAVCASRDNVEALRQENDAETVQTTPAAYHAANPLYSTSASSLIQIPPCGSPNWDASSGTSWSSERPARSEPTRPSNGWEHRDHDPESFGDAGAQHETEDGCEGFPGRHEDVGLRAEIEQLKRKNAELSSELAAVSSQLATVFARLDALTTSPGASSLRRYAAQPDVR